MQTGGIDAGHNRPRTPRNTDPSNTTMAAKKSNPAMDFIVNTLKANRGASYADISESAAKKKLKVYPIMFGRAQALLGIVKMAPRGQGKMARKKAGLPPKRGPGRPRKNPVGSAS